MHFHFSITLKYLTFILFCTFVLYSCDTGWGSKNVKETADCYCGCETQYGTFTDVRDSSVYHTILIGTQTWMADNLAYLPEVSSFETESSTEPVYTVFEYAGTRVEEAIKTSNYKTFGVRYNWSAAKEACPPGWHIPSDEEWAELENYLIAQGNNYDGSLDEDKIAKSLAACCYWAEIDKEGTIGNVLENNNNSCFSAIPGGYDIGTGFSCAWWSSTILSEKCNWIRYLSTYSVAFDKCSRERTAKFSVRCIKD